MDNHRSVRTHVEAFDPRMRRLLMIRMRPSKNQIRFLIAVAAGYAISTGNVFAQYYNQPTPRIALQQSIGSSETIDLTGDAPEEKSASDRVSSEATLPAKSKKEFLADKIDSDSKGSIQPLGRTIPSWQLPTGSNNCNYSACNLPPQPQVPAGRCTLPHGNRLCQLKSSATVV